MCSILATCLLVTLTTQQLLQPSIIAAISLIALNGLLIFPIGGLFAFHIVLVSKGRTTNEHVTGKYKGMNYFTHGCCINIIHLLCGSLVPRYGRVISDKKRKISKNSKKPSSPSKTSKKSKGLAVDDIEIQNLNQKEDEENDKNQDLDTREKNSKKPSVGKENELLDLVLKNKKLKQQQTGAVSNIDDVDGGSRSLNSGAAGVAADTGDKSLSSLVLDKGGNGFGSTRHDRNAMNNTSFDSNKRSTRIDSK
jgi:hypothetical protein